MLKKITVIPAPVPH